MKISMKTPLACTLFAASLIGTSQAAVTAFTEDFSTALASPPWTVTGDVTIDTVNACAELTHDNGSPLGTAKLVSSTGGTLSDYTHEITFNITDFLDPNTQSDIKWKTAGADGSSEIVINSFGNARWFHNDGTMSGNLFSNVSLGISEGDALTLQQMYSQATDTMTISYSVNGGASTQLYSGNGIGGTVGDIITTRVETELLQWNATNVNEPSIKIDEWSLAAQIPEPSSAALIGLGGLALVLRRRK